MTRDWQWPSFVVIEFDHGSIILNIGPVVWILGAILSILLIARICISRQPLGLQRLTGSLLGGRWRLISVTSNLLGTRWHIERNRETAQLAHQAYVELITRKAGIEFDEDNDVIVEVYDSWYVLFGEIRRLSRRIDAESIARNPDLRQLHELLIAVLNGGLRPHLTKWQARFRRWYDEAVRSHPNESPQSVQRLYPEYVTLVQSLRDANRVLIQLSSDLRVLSHGRAG